MPLQQLFYTDKLPTLTEKCKTYIKEETMIGKFNNNLTEAIPNYAVNAMATRRNILRFLNEDRSTSTLGFTVIADVAEKVSKHAKKIFVICVDREIEMSFLYHMVCEQEATDAKFPFTDKYPVHPNHRETLEQNFVPYQSVLDTAGGILRQDYFDQMWPSMASLPIKVVKSETKGGAGGKIYKITLDTGFISSDDTNLSAVNGRWTKTLVLKAVEKSINADRERKFLQALQSSGVHDPHILRTYTGFTCAGIYYLVSDMADHNLREYMQQSIPPQAGTSWTWLKTQLTGLAKALAKVHHMDSQSKVGVMHDIKAENVLVFGTGDQSTLRFTDWGCAMISVRGDSPTNRKRGQRTYTPPEAFDDENHKKMETSRPHDIWSLGCLYLEMLVWMTEGKTGLKTFFENRLEGCNGSDNFHYQGAVNVAVTNIMKKLRMDPRQWVSKLVDIIEKMLQVGPRDRPNAEGVVNELQRVRIP
ncbi:hypothetical protein N0V83_008823 [Neocucurbitaria cava]|uniref:Protein kinase domain-containing protein n=1 Tax=Neocucurbitaria cava TaxID=798079 RepID=A0A9W9CJ19_9PLEO|nr:hypothetical protein N0V83_008823 [Neocucurbitaria cava]